MLYNWMEQTAPASVWGVTGKQGRKDLFQEEKGPSLSSRQPARGGPFLLLSSQEGTTDNDLEHSLLFGMLHLSSLHSSVRHGVQFLF